MTDLDIVKENCISEECNLKRDISIENYGDRICSKEEDDLTKDTTNNFFLRRELPREGCLSFGFFKSS